VKVKLGRIRAVEKVSYAEAVKIVEAGSRDDECSGWPTVWMSVSCEI
jgi:hypothetical protein